MLPFLRGAADVDGRVGLLFGGALVGARGGRTTLMATLVASNSASRDARYAGSGSSRVGIAPCVLRRLAGPDRPGQIR